MSTRDDLGPWGDWEGPLECIYIDAERFPTLGSAMREARSWVTEVGDEYVVRAKGAVKRTEPMHDQCDGWCDDADCITDHLVWRIPLEGKP